MPRLLGGGYGIPQEGVTAPLCRIGVLKRGGRGSIPIVSISVPCEKKRSGDDLAFLISPCVLREVGGILEVGLDLG